MVAARTRKPGEIPHPRGRGLRYSRRRQRDAGVDDREAGVQRAFGAGSDAIVDLGEPKNPFRECRCTIDAVKSSRQLPLEVGGEIQGASQ